MTDKILNIQKKKNSKDKYILFYFLAFFGVVFLVNGIFIYTAISSQPGVVTEQAYEKGLAYNNILHEAEKQSSIQNVIKVDGTMLQWTIHNTDKVPVSGAVIKALAMRPVQDGIDTVLAFREIKKGVYTADLAVLPLKGQWLIKMESQWNNQIYKASHLIVVK